MYRMFGPSRVDEAPEKCFSRLRVSTKPRKNVFRAFARRRSPGKMFFAPSRVDEAPEKCFLCLRASTKPWKNVFRAFARRRKGPFPYRRFARTRLKVSGVINRYEAI